MGLDTCVGVRGVGVGVGFGGHVWVYGGCGFGHVYGAVCARWRSRSVWEWVGLEWVKVGVRVDGCEHALMSSVVSSWGVCVPHARYTLVCSRELTCGLCQTDCLLVHALMCVLECVLCYAAQNPLLVGRVVVVVEGWGQKIQKSKCPTGIKCE